MQDLDETVIKNGYCIGCGACSVVSDDYTIKLNDFGQYQASYKKNIKTRQDNPTKVCPFSNNAANEDELSTELFPDLQDDPCLGRITSSYFGYSNKLRDRGASGALTTWFLQKLIEEKIVDGVIHLKENANNQELLFSYAISSTVNEVLEGAKTKYYPGELSSIYKRILNESDDKKYAVVGVPCFIKASRLLAKSIPKLEEKIIFHVGLVCGHYKTTHYAEMLAWQKGINRGNITKFDFRHKPGFGRAGDYHTKIEYRKENKLETLSQSVKQFHGTDWGLGLFKYNACDYCDDVVGETADISFGDAWIDPYNKDHLGTNVVVIRNKLVQEIFDKSYHDAEISIEKASVQDVIKTQLSGFRHRRLGLSLRLFWKKKGNKWVPNKRVSPSRKGSLKYKVIFKFRMILSHNSHRFFKLAKKYNQFGLYQLLMFPFSFFYKYIIYGIPRIKILIDRKFNR